MQRGGNIALCPYPPGFYLAGTQAKPLTREKCKERKEEHEPTIHPAACRWLLNRKRSTLPLGQQLDSGAVACLSETTV